MAHKPAILLLYCIGAYLTGTLMLQLVLAGFKPLQRWHLRHIPGKFSRHSERVCQC